MRKPNSWFTAAVSMINACILLLCTASGLSAHTLPAPTPIPLPFGVEATTPCSATFTWGCNFLGSPARTIVFNLPGTTGWPQLQSWTISPPASVRELDGYFAYVYRIEMTTVGIDKANPPATIPCITSLSVPFGPISPPYANYTNVPFDVFVLANPYGGDVSLTSAERVGNTINFTFPPLCAGTRDTSMIFGATSKCPAQLLTAEIHETSGVIHNGLARVPTATSDNYLWPLSGCASPEERDPINTSFGPRINRKNWDFHNGMDLPEISPGSGTPIYAAKGGHVHRASNANSTYSSRHVVIREHDTGMFQVYLHLDSFSVVGGDHVLQGQQIGVVGDDNATYHHLHFELRDGGFQVDSVHPLSLMSYTDTNGFTAPVSDRFNHLSSLMAARLLFEAPDKDEGDLLRVEVDLLNAAGTVTNTRVIDFNDPSTFHQDNDDACSYRNDIAVEGYQKSNMLGATPERADLKYGILVRELPSTVTTLQARVTDVGGNTVPSAMITLPTHAAFDKNEGFESVTFPPTDWDRTPSSGTSSRDCSTAKTGSCSMLSDTTSSMASRDGIEIDLPTDRFEWVVEAEFNPETINLANNKSLYLFHLLHGTARKVAARIRKSSNKLYAGLIAENPADVEPKLPSDTSSFEIPTGQWKKWTLHVLRLGTRETTARLYIDDDLKAEVNWDTSIDPPNRLRAGIARIDSGNSAKINTDDLRLTEMTPSATAACP